MVAMRTCQYCFEIIGPGRRILTCDQCYNLRRDNGACKQCGRGLYKRGLNRYCKVCDEVPPWRYQCKCGAFFEPPNKSYAPYGCPDCRTRKREFRSEGARKRKNAYTRAHRRAALGRVCVCGATDGGGTLWSGADMCSACHKRKYRNGLCPCGRALYTARPGNLPDRFGLAGPVCDGCIGEACCLKCGIFKERGYIGPYCGRCMQMDLTQRELEVLIRRYGAGKVLAPRSLRAVGKKMGLSTLEVRVIENWALRKLQRGKTNGR